MKDNKSHIFKETFWFLVKLSIAAGIVGYLIFSRRGQLAKCFTDFEYIWLFPAMFFYGCHMAVCAWRWHQLARILAIPLSPFEALSLTMQGYFFSLVIPGGAIGGDVVKMGVISKRSTSGSKMEGAFTVLMDRIIGMIALFLLALTLLIPAVPLIMQVDLPGFSGTYGNKLLIAMIVLLCSAGLTVIFVIFFHRTLKKVPLLGFLMNWGDRRTGGMVNRLTSATDTYALHWKHLGVLTFISIIFIHLMTVIPMFFLLAGLNVDFDIFTVTVALTLGNIVGLIPLFPGGIGGRDITVIAILTAGNIAGSDADAAQLLYTGIIILFNLLGGLFFIFDPGRKTLQR